MIHEAKAFFVTRAKSHTQFTRRYLQPVDRINTVVICDQTSVRVFAVPYGYNMGQDVANSHPDAVIADISVLLE